MPAAIEMTSGRRSGERGRDGAAGFRHLLRLDREHDHVRVVDCRDPLIDDVHAEVAVQPLALSRRPGPPP